ncbi:MAG: Rnf-Nqr domain containing protein [Oscillospiraceae bacterium]
MNSNNISKSNNQKKDSLGSIIYNSMVRNNHILVLGTAIAPVIVIANTLKNAAYLALTFSVITFFTMLLSSFIPQRVVYTVRVIIYIAIGSLVYVPTAIIVSAFFPQAIENMGIYFPLLITNSFIIFHSDTMFLTEKKGRMILDLIFGIIGYDIVVLLFGLVREIFSTGEINGKVIALPMLFKAFYQPFGGFILLGIFAAVLRGILLLIKKISN